MKQPIDHVGEDDCLWLGWKWFELHAKQRLEVLKFFTIIYGGLIFGILGVIQVGLHSVAVVGAVCLVLACIIFWQLDVRSLQLIEIGERIIASRWADLGFAAELEPTSGAGVRQTSGIRFKHAFGIAYLIAGIFAVFVFAAVMANFLYPDNFKLPKIH